MFQNPPVLLSPETETDISVRSRARNINLLNFWNMKKIALFFASVMAFAGVASADDKPITFEQLPAKAQQFIKTNFPQEKIAFTSLDRDIFGDTYDVLFASGTKLEFTDKGEWKEIECKYSTVDEKFIPEQIRKYVTDTYPGTKYVKIEKGKNGYEVELTNGLELTFDRNFVLIDIDD